ncbi:flavin reductase family protein [Nocardioides euryhalodurans]|uniref:Flavin reductase n=1 Tax=Nocardioides euryhalodurans TaxID=2518370 RepID=A0A4P7GH97_9ACTN|nr:flavin reductase family protein [Nocardioides euryhalodurans]QBR91029.1 flavin reductase [Nocardioides euryhalodurans]
MQESGDQREADDFELRPGEMVHLSHEPGSDAAALRFRDVLGRFATGLTVVSATGEDGPVGMTVQGFLSLSLEPPLVLVSMARTSRAWPVIERAGTFCVTILAADQQWLAELMATRGADKFRDLAWTPSPATGSPLLPGGLGHVDCRVEAVHDGGDHLLVVGRVLDLSATGDGEALLYHRGRYGATVTRPGDGPRTG